VFYPTYLRISISMKPIFRYTFLLFLFWFTVFFIHRLFFILYQLPLHNKISKYGELIKAPLAGYRLDISTSTVLILLPLTCAFCYMAVSKNIFTSLAKYSSLLFLLIYTLVGIGDSGLYREWNAKINMQALTHFKNPSEVINLLSFKLSVLFLIAMAVLYIPFYLIYQKKIHPVLREVNPIDTPNRIGISAVAFLLSIGLGIVLIRGGITNIPINQSVAYFSNEVFANDVAVNPLYNLVADASIANNIPEPSKYQFRSSKEASALIADDFKTKGDTTISILHTKKPNLLFIFLESWSADNVSVLGGIPGCTPSFDALSKEGLLFTKAYANAYVSDQGIPAILSGYPSVSRIAVINQTSKISSIPCINEELKDIGYQSSFLFGGDLVYGNLRAYLLEKKFDNIVEQRDLPHYPTGKLGIHDADMFPELLTQIRQQKPPFLQAFFTVSSHMPYDYKPSDRWSSKKSDPEKSYTESVHYSDIHLGKFFEQAKKEPWYENTLCVVVADHSHNSIKQTKPASAMHAHIPLLMLGGALKKEWKGKTWDKIVSQLDLVSGLLYQLQLPANRYPWSRNMFNPNTPSSAFYVFFGGAGYVNKYGYASSYQGNPKQIISNIKDSSQLKQCYDKAMSFQQLIYDEVSAK
jgi:phosphoglycerol transferase MdoB-like AlkP superfamily enzyme